LQNGAGVYTQPDENNVTVALGYAHERGNGTFALSFDGPDPRAYFPSTYSYVLAQTAGFDPAKGAVIGEFLCYATSQGQVIAPDLRYARLSSELVKIATDAIEQIPGAPPRSQCFIGTALPPPPPQLCSSNCPTTSTTVGPNGQGNTQVGNGTGPGSGSNARARAIQALRRAACLQTVARAAKAATAQQGKSKVAKGATTTTTTVPSCSALGGSLGGGGANGTTATTGQSGDTQLARATAAPTGHSSGSIAIWLLLAGAVTALAVTTYASRRRTVG
jgi:hypothetical protein